MKISNSKKQLAKIISENGGWREGAKFSAQDKDGEIFFYETKPTRGQYAEVWGHNGVLGGDWINCGKALTNWHQTILSSDEYFHLYPAPDADVWIEWEGGEYPGGSGVAKRRDGVEVEFNETATRNWGRDFICKSLEIVAYRLRNPEQQKSTAVGDDETNLAAKEELEALEFDPAPTIEQLAAEYRNRKDYAERKQQEADAAKADADVKLAELVAAGKAVGLVVGVAALEPEAEKQLRVFRNEKLGPSPEYNDTVRFELCEECGRRFGVHFGDANHCPLEDYDA